MFSIFKSAQVYFIFNKFLSTFFLSQFLSNQQEKLSCIKYNNSIYHKILVREMGEILSTAKEQIQKILGSICTQTLQTQLLSVLKLKFKKSTSHLRQFPQLCNLMENIQQKLSRQKILQVKNQFQKTQYLKQQNELSNRNFYDSPIIKPCKNDSQIARLVEQNRKLLLSTNQLAKKYANQRKSKQNFKTQYQKLHQLKTTIQKKNHEIRELNNQLEKRLIDYQTKVRKLQQENQQLKQTVLRKDLKIEKKDLENINCRNKNSQLEYFLKNQRGQNRRLKQQIQEAKYRSELKLKLQTQSLQKIQKQLNKMINKQTKQKLEVTKKYNDEREKTEQLHQRVAMIEIQNNFLRRESQRNIPLSS